MDGTWWVGQSELDKDQRNIISLPIDKKILVTGPPGSGKTNLLLLRANYIYLAGNRNIAVITFTRSLREFIASGANNYDFPSQNIMTCHEWQFDFLRQYGGVSVRLTDDFKENRVILLREMIDLVERLQLHNVLDAILLDEAQDYTPDEIRLFDRLSERLFCVADERQKIYLDEDPIEVIKGCIDETHTLRYHYRNGLKICKVADEIAKRWQGYQPLAETSNYDENANPSTVDRFKCITINDQIDLVLSRLKTQRPAFPGELIGILSPTKQTMRTVWDALMSSEHAEAAFLLHGSSSDRFLPNKQVIVSTFHAAKGLEFRALHLIGCEELKLSFFKNNRRLTFTAITRAKTSLTVYHGGDLYPYFDAALHHVIQPEIIPPDIDAVFGGAK